MGYVGNDVDSRFLPNGSAVTNITVATSKKWRDKESGEQREQTEWSRCVAFGKLAENMEQYLRKGSKVYIEGALRTRNWEKDGQKHYTTEIVVSEMRLLDSRGDSGAGSQGSAQHRGAMTTGPGGDGTMVPEAAVNQRVGGTGTAQEDDDSSIPF